MTQNDYDWSPLEWCVTRCPMDWTHISKLTNVPVEDIESIAATCPITEEQVKAMYVPGSSGWMHMLVLYVLAVILPPPQNIIELGAYVGFSTKFLHAGLHNGPPTPTLYSVDISQFGIDLTINFTSGKDLRTPAIQNGLVQRASLLTEEEKKDVTFIIGDAIEWLERYDGPPFDLAFEDTDHAYKTTKRILELLVPHMKLGGIIISHDVVMDEHLDGIPMPPVNQAWDDTFEDYLKFSGMAFVKI